MRYIICFLLILCCLPGYTQEYQVFKGDTINRKDAKGLKQGVWRKYYRTDTLMSESFFVNNKPVGSTRTWYENGKLKGIVQLDKSGKKGSAITYFESGKVLAKGNYLDQKKDSIWVYYHEKADTLSAVESYTRGIQHGRWMVFYEDGKLAHEITYVKGKKDGVVKQYNDDGRLIFEITYVNGVENGPSVLYYTDGKVRERGSYKNGMRQGKWLSLDKNGSVTETILYENGEEVK